MEDKIEKIEKDKICKNLMIIGIDKETGNGDLERRRGETDKRRVYQRETIK